MALSVGPLAQAAQGGGGATADEAVPGSDFHLVESSDGWTLTISLSSRMLDVLLGGTDVIADGDGESDESRMEGPGRSTSPSVLAAAAPPTQSSFTVHVEPNLVSGHPFPARVVIVRPPD
ncbi:MAG: hypothetical protein M3N95_02795 [Actinomycetota bacterium]|nr:hypothetical protein [Actinomycetota bacterium]